MSSLRAGEEMSESVAAAKRSETAAAKRSETPAAKRSETPAAKPNVVETATVNAASPTRRRFLRSAGGALAAPWLAAPWIASAAVLGRGAGRAPSERLAIAGIGLGAMGADDLRAAAGEEIAALCDVDDRMAAVTYQRHPRARRYRDFRRLLEQEKGLDAVIVATPDHTHAAITAAALRLGKHVYTEMPLAHDIGEARALERLAREAKVATQMGNERYSEPTIRTLVEWLRDGCIAGVREVHCWTNRPRWPQGLARPAGAEPVPPGLDWDLWLGPAPERPYHRAYHPYLWRGWRDFGTGALGAIGCHEIAGAYWALDLAASREITVEAESEGGTGESYPLASTIRYRFAAAGSRPALTLTWYDGGRRPPRPPELPETREFLGSNGSLFAGEKGKLVTGALVAGTNPGQAGPRFLPESLGDSYRRPRATIPRIRGKGRWVESSRHVSDWLRACRGERPACSRFEVAAPLTEIVLLGNVALAAGEPIRYDRARGEIASPAGANRYLRRAPRKGWEI